MKNIKRIFLALGFGILFVYLIVNKSEEAVSFLYANF